MIDILNEKGPIPNAHFQALLRQNMRPLKMPSNAKAIDYDLHFVWRQADSRGFKSAQFRIYFGNYFRNPEEPYSSITIGPGKPYKTDSVIVHLDPPSDVVGATYSFKPRMERKQYRTGYLYHTIGQISSKALIDKLYETAKELHIDSLVVPKKPGETVSIKCSLLPIKKGDEFDRRICVLQIDKVDKF